MLPLDDMQPDAKPAQLRTPAASAAAATMAADFSGQVNVGQAVFGIHSRTCVADEILHRLTALRVRLGDRPAAAIVDGIAAELSNPTRNRIASGTCWTGSPPRSPVMNG